MIEKMESVMHNPSSSDYIKQVTRTKLDRAAAMLKKSEKVVEELEGMIANERNKTTPTKALSSNKRKAKTPKNATSPSSTKKSKPTDDASNYARRLAEICSTSDEEEQSDDDSNDGNDYNSVAFLQGKELEFENEEY